MAAIEAMLASVNTTVSQGKDLQEALSKAINAIASVQTKSSNIRRTLYPSLAKLFGRLEKGAMPRFDLSSLKSILFGTDVEVEAIRLLRADAIVAAMEQPWLAEEVRSDLDATRASESSKSVLARLPS